MNTIENEDIAGAAPLPPPSAQMRAYGKVVLRSLGLPDWMDDEDTLTLSPDHPEDHAPFNSEKRGDCIGRYRLVKEIGEGGFGVVWMAEQTEPVTRMVALKIIKAGMDTREVIARFEAERQAVAMMDHPSIARVFDAGATQSGRPYFVMELVPGVKITDYCDQQELDPAGRIRLFIAVCYAVQHAHQKGIIHRDLKPSNILVTTGDDNEPLPKVIDFGVAKATQGRLAENTPRTHSEQLIGTPLYMSPEQAETAFPDIDTRSDIYSLGVLLYELLTGHTPIGQETLHREGINEVRRIICDVDPKLPSLCVKSLRGENRELVAKRRRAGPDKLPQLLHGDLDWIVMKALDKDRTQRYDTAGALALDLRRFLACEPVSAAAPSRFYRIRKFARRHRTAFGVTVAVAGVLITATVISVMQAVRATAAEALARQRVVEKDTALKEAEGAFKFLTDLFQSADPDRDGRTVTMAETLARAASKLDTDAAISPLRKAKLQGAVGWTLQSLGLYHEAVPLLKKARDYFLATAGENDRETYIATHNLAWTLFRDNQVAEAIQLREKVLPHFREVVGPDFPGLLTVMDIFDRPAFALEADRARAGALEEDLLKHIQTGFENQDTLDAMVRLASFYQENSHSGEAVRTWKHVVSLSEKLNGPATSSTFWALQALAAAVATNGQREESIRIEEQVLSGRRAVLRADHPDTLMAMDNLADSLAAAGRREEAVKLDTEALALSCNREGLESLTIRIQGNLGDFYADLGQPRKALEIQEKVLAAWKAMSPPDVRHTLEAMTAMAATLTLLKDTDRAEKLLTEVLEKTEASGAPKDLEARLRTMAELRFRQKQFAAGETLCCRRIESRRSRPGWENSFTIFDAHVDTGRLLSEWAWEERETQPQAAHDHAIGATALLREALAADLRDKAGAAQRRPDVLSRLGGALCAAARTDPSLSPAAKREQFGEAEKFLLEGQTGMERESTTKPPQLRDGLERLVRLYDLLNDPKQATAWREKLDTFDKSGT